jgi:nucleotide-binding universal stress UspA family protein
MKTITAVPRRQSSRISNRVKIDSSRLKQLQIRKVLVPTDFSEASLEAIKFALPILKSFNAELHLVHVAPQDYPLSSLAALPMILPALEMARDVQHHLRKAAVRHSLPFQRENMHALRGRPSEQICQLARKINVDLIVMSTRGHTGLKHLTLGSTTERVVRYSPCPVLIVRQVNPAENGNGSCKTPHVALHIRKILVPVDFSDCSRQGVEYAKRLAKQFRATLVLLHSVYFQYHVTSDEYARYDYPLLVQEADKAAQQQMRELVHATESDGIKVESLLKTGHVGEQICDQARFHDADLIVTSTHGWTGFKHVLLGSTAEYVVNHARCPVLVVPTHERSVINSTKHKHETANNH